METAIVATAAENPEIEPALRTAAASRPGSRFQAMEMSTRNEPGARQTAWVSAWHCGLHHNRVLVLTCAVIPSTETSIIGSTTCDGAELGIKCEKLYALASTFVSAAYTQQQFGCSIPRARRQTRPKPFDI